ncbi:MAG: triose-phosphate isomerase, partial [Bacteroidetes bacterium]|nr:triose-phosphate isomerase [Bacteroidota bacterium]
MRTKIVAGNWKMNKSFEEADELINKIIDLLKEADLSDKAVIICPPAVFLELATDQAFESDIYVGAQNISMFESGAYTGEISAAMLNSMGVDFCIIGHSERRKYFN